MNILVLGSSGLIGNNIYKVLRSDPSLNVFGTFNSCPIDILSKNKLTNILFKLDIRDFSNLKKILLAVKPDVVINCVGITKHQHNCNTEDFVQINSLFPHLLASTCILIGARLIHISSDCVFNGTKGFYSELDETDATDIYGKSKALGEFCNEKILVLRTSTIGHEIRGNSGLLNWFLSQDKSCTGFGKAIFSGLPAVVLGQIILKFVLKNGNLRGLYNVSASAISKYDLLKLIAKIYQKEIDIKIDNTFIIDRTLDGSKFNNDTGYFPPDWEELVELMHRYQ